MINKDEIICSLKSFMKENNKKYSITKIGVFGSVSRNCMTDDSDIDIVVELEKPDFSNLISIKQELENQFHRHVDIVRYRNKMNKYLKHRIDIEAIYV